MSNDTKNERNQDELSSENRSENNEVESREYDLKIRCTTARDGSRSCEIRDITIIEPKTDEKKPVETADTAEKQDIVPPVAASGSVVIEEASEGKCSLCEALEDVVKGKVRAAAPRQFHLSGRPRRMIRS